MNSRIIAYQISRKVHAWLDSIEDKNLREYLKDKVVVTGGCIASMLLNEKVNDYDLYLTTKEAVLRTAEYYVALFKKNHPGLNREILVVDGAKVQYEGQYVQYGLTPERVAIIVKSAGVAGDDKDVSDPEAIADADQDHESKDEKKKEDEPKNHFKPRYLTSNAITLFDKLQIVVRFYGTLDEVHQNFDFQHVLSYWESANNGQLHLNPKALECLLTKELKYVGSKYPLCSIIRLRKFLARGFHINAGEILKICYQLSELDLKSVPTLADQLVGVDTTYFAQLIRDIQIQKEKDKEFEISYGYLASIIDQTF